MIPGDATVIIESLNPIQNSDPLAQCAWIELEAQRACLALGLRDFTDSESVLLGPQLRSVPLVV